MRYTVLELVLDTALLTIICKEVQDVYSSFISVKLRKNKHECIYTSKQTAHSACGAVILWTLRACACHETSCQPTRHKTWEPLLAENFARS